MPILTRPKITWGSSFVNTLNIGYLFDNPTSYSNPLDGSERIKLTSGGEDSWIVGYEYFLRGRVRWIPTANSTNPTATGWDGTTGWRAFLEWTWNSNPFRWYPDKDTASYKLSYLVTPDFKAAPAIEMDGSRTLSIVIRNTTSDYSGY